MNKAILHSEVQKFIKNFDGDSSKLAFAGSPFENISIQELLEQIESRKKIEKKLPKWFKTEGIYYPPKLNLEQTSSEITARYKTSLVSGSKLADITGGFGVDTFFFSKVFKAVDHFEMDTNLAEISEYNFGVLNIDNVTCHATDGLLSCLGNHYNVIYADPSRRNEDKGKVFLLDDCTPNIPYNLESLLKSSPIVLLKTSPMLDINAGIIALSNVKEIHVVAAQNEVKELLWILERNFTGDTKILTVNFGISEVQNFNYTLNIEGKSTFGLPREYLYEPNAAIMKSGGFSLLSSFYDIDKLHENTHLFTDNNLIEFPGRVFRITAVVPYSKKDMRTGINFDKANVAIRNFPEPVSALRKRWKIKDGGNLYIFFTTAGANEKMMLLCEKITK